MQNARLEREFFPCQRKVNDELSLPMVSRASFLIPTFPYDFPSKFYQIDFH